MSELRVPTTETTAEPARRPNLGPGMPMSRIKPTHRGFAPRDGIDSDGVVLTSAVSTSPPGAAEEFRWGEPIDDPPPIVEGFLEEGFLGEESVGVELAAEAASLPEPAAPVAMPSGRPTRRGFLAPSSPEFPRRELPPGPPPAEPPPAEPLPAPEMYVSPPPEAAPPQPVPPLASETDAIAPWWREPPAETQTEPAQAAYAADEPMLPAAREARRDMAATASRLGAVLQVAGAWWYQQRRPILAATAVVAVVVVVAGVFGIGPLERISHRKVPPLPAAAPSASAPIAEPQPAPAPQAARTAPPDDPVARVPFYLDRAKSGDAESALELAILYAKGDGVTQDYQQAANWFRAAGENGVARAQYDLGVLYERGRGVPVNYNEAFSWYSRAAEGNFALAQYNLAVAYTRGQGTRQDFVAAAGWYRRAAVQGVTPAMVNLAILYERGEGVGASAIDAYAWYRAAASRGNQPSAKRAAELFDVLSAADRARAETRTATVLADLPAALPGDAASTVPATLKSGLEPDGLDKGDGKAPAKPH